MALTIPIILAVEDPLSEDMIRVILARSGRSFNITACYGKQGFGYLRKQVPAFNLAARHTPFLMLVDLDRAECPPTLINEWLSHPKARYFIFRVAVREIESWIMADSESFANYFGLKKKKDLIPKNPDSVDDPKKLLIELVSKSKKRELRESIVPALGSSLKTGPDYNGQLGFFVAKFWKPESAMLNSPSLNRTMKAIKSFSYDG